MPWPNPATAPTHASADAEPRLDRSAPRPEHTSAARAAKQYEVTPSPTVSAAPNAERQVDEGMKTTRNMLTVVAMMAAISLLAGVADATILTFEGKGSNGNIPLLQEGVSWMREVCHFYSAQGWSLGVNRFSIRGKRMGQVLRATGTEDQASAERSASGQTPHPRPALHSSQSDAGATHAPLRGIKFPISHQRVS